MSRFQQAIMDKDKMSSASTSADHQPSQTTSLMAKKAAVPAKQAVMDTFLTAKSFFAPSDDPAVSCVAVPAKAHQPTLRTKPVKSPALVAPPSIKSEPSDVSEERAKPPSPTPAPTPAPTKLAVSPEQPVKRKATTVDAESHQPAPMKSVHCDIMFFILMR
jgi:hypothetical protein